MPSPIEPPIHVGSILGQRYHLDRHIARGGMGDVYGATDRLLDRPVAVKVYRAASPGDRTRFDAEVRLLAGLAHPGLVHVFDAGTVGDDAYVVLELIDGPSVRELLAEHQHLAPARVAELGVAVADALASIHAEGVVHRDVTPANILVANGRARLVDFGIARLFDSPRVTATAMAVGTPAYMSPEQVSGHDVGPATDVYALGLLLLEALTGRRAFEGTISELVAARLVRDPDTETDVPGPWRPLLTAMVARSPEDRPTANEVAAELRALARGDVTATLESMVATTATVAQAEGGTRTVALDVGGTALFPVGMAPEDGPPRTAGRRLPVWALVAAAAALVVGLAVAAADGSGAPTPPTTVGGAGAGTTVVTSTTVAPTTTPSTVPVPAPAKGHGKGKAKLKGD